jgi:hypothetical protein
MLHRLVPPLATFLFRGTGQNLDFIANNPSAQLFTAIARAWYINGGRIDPSSVSQTNYRRNMHVHNPLHLQLRLKQNATRVS